MKRAGSDNITLRRPAYYGRQRLPYGPSIVVSCARCGVQIVRPRWHANIRINQYCSRDCYRAWMREQGASFRQNRHGQRLARRVVAAHFPLPPSQVVHHHDGDNLNNHISNLAVFASNAAHMSFHRGGAGRPVWDGRVQSSDAGIGTHTGSNLSAWPLTGAVLSEAPGVPARPRRPFSM